MRSRERGSSHGWSTSYRHFRGFKLHAVISEAGVLRDLVLTPANLRESRVCFSGTGLLCILGDKGYDSVRLIDRYARDGVVLLVPLRRLGRCEPTGLRGSNRAYLNTAEGRRLYRRRSVVERYFAHPKRQPWFSRPVSSPQNLSDAVILEWLAHLLSVEQLTGRNL